MTQRKKFDCSQPGAQELANSIVHGAATTEGTMVAFPACFPGVTVPVTADESRITAMDSTANGIIYAGTSGYASHLLVGMFHGITGMVFDMGTVAEGTHCTAVCCGQKKLAAMVNGPTGGRLIWRKLEPLPFDLIQEWHIARSDWEVLEEPFDGEKIMHAVAAQDRSMVVGVTENRLFTFDCTSGAITFVGDVPGCGRLAVGPGGNVFGPDTDNTLWRYDVRTGVLTRRAIPLPDGMRGVPALMWARSIAGGPLYTIGARGNLFSFSETRGFAGPLATIPLLPAGAMAVTFDGRLYVSAGEGMARLFCFNPLSCSVTDLGVAVSVIERRRYGYCFGDAVTGRDGEIVFGENDDLGHLWLYFPKIQPVAVNANGNHIQVAGY